jgi:hypothetical protein
MSLSGGGSQPAPTPPPPLPSIPAQASYIARGGVGASGGGRGAPGQLRPVAPVIGTTRSVVGRPTLLGGGTK